MSLRRWLLGPTRREREQEATLRLFRATVELAAAAIKAAADVRVAELQAVGKAKEGQGHDPIR